MSVLNKIKLNGELYDIGAKIENISIDEAFLGRYNDDILFVSGVVAWKNDIEDISFDSLILTEILDNDSVKYLLSVSNTDGSVSYYGKDGAIDTPDINKALTHEEVKAKSTNNSDINLKILVDYLLNNDNNSSILFDYNIFNATTRRDSISECKTIYELLKYFDGTVAGPTERIIHITDFSKSERSEIMESYGAYEPRTKKHTVDENGNECVANQDEDVDIVLINHSGDMDSTRTEDGMVQSIYQTVRIYKQDGALELGSGKAEGFSAIATGKNTSAEGNFSVAMGNESSVGEHGESGIALGKGAIVYSEGTVALGSYNTGDSSAVLDVGNGKGPRGGERSSSFKSMKNGENWSKSAFTIAANDNKEPTDNELIVNTDKFVVTKEGDFKAKGFGIINGESNNGGNVLEVNAPDGNFALKTDTKKDTRIAHDLYVGNDEFVKHNSTIGNDEEVKHRLTVGEYIIDGQYNEDGDTVKIDNRPVSVNSNDETIIGLEPYPGNKIYHDTYAHNIYPTKNESYILGEKESPLRWKELNVVDIDASGKIKTNILEADSFTLTSLEEPEKDENGEILYSEPISFNASMYPGTDKYYSLGSTDQSWLDGYFDGRLFSESLNSETITRKFGTHFNLLESTLGFPNVSKYKNKSIRHDITLMTAPNGSTVSKPKITIDYSTGRLDIVWAGYTNRIINFNPTGGNALGYHTRAIHRFFHPASFIATAIGRNVPVTLYVGGDSTTTRYTGYIKCGWSTSDGRNAFNNFISNYSDPDKDDVAGLENKIFYYHNMYCFAKRYGCSRKIINYYKNKRNNLALNFKRESAAAFATFIKDITNYESKVTNQKGCLFMDSTTRMPKNSYVLLSASCDTGLDYDDLVLIKYLTDAMSGYTNSIIKKPQVIDNMKYGGNSRFFIPYGLQNDNTLYSKMINDIDIIHMYGGKDATELTKEQIDKFFPANAINSDGLPKDSFGEIVTGFEEDIDEFNGINSTEDTSTKPVDPSGDTPVIPDVGTVDTELIPSGEIKLESALGENVYRIQGKLYRLILDASGSTGGTFIPLDIED